MRFDKLDYQSLAVADQRHHVHPFSVGSSKPSLLICEADGAYVTDHRGHRMLDGMAGLWCVNVGYGRRSIAEAMAQQATQMAYFSPFGNLSSPPAAALSKRLAELAPKNLNHVFYSSGGSTAVDIAVSLVHFYQNQRGKKGKKLILSRHEAYHGMTYVSASLTGIEWNNWGFDTVDFVKHIAAANVFRKPSPDMSDAEYCDWLCNDLKYAIKRYGADSIAAFIAEPIMGAGGVLIAPQGYHRRIKEICAEHDILYIYDEVVTAFGRLGEWFSSDTVFDVQPDIIVAAKGLTSGYAQLGATLISDEIHDVISQPQCKGGMLSRGFTYSAHPVSCAAALASIDIIEREKLLDNVRRVGAYLSAQLATLREYPVVADVRGMHFMHGIEYGSPLGTHKCESTISISKLISDYCQSQGLIIRPVGHCLNVISPPLIWQEQHVDEAVAILRSGVEFAMSQLR